VIFGERERKDLSDEECASLAFSHDYVLTAPCAPQLTDHARISTVAWRH
jgi:hypothetical protein